MTKKHVVIIVIIFTAIVAGRYGHVVYSWFGLDVTGYTADMAGKKASYAVHGAIKQQKITQCFKNAGISDTSVSRLNMLVKDIQSGGLIASPALQQCVEMRINGYASPKKDVQRTITSIKEIFIEKIAMHTVQYTPSRYGMHGMTVSLPKELIGKQLAVTCNGSYSQLFDNGYGDVPCRGFYQKDVPLNYLKKFPVQDKHKVGALLFEQKTESSIKLYLNVPKEQSVYRTIIGTIAVTITAIN